MGGSGDTGQVCRLFRVTGRVQGVFFRASTQTAARDLGLTGYARNMDDGSVEVLACGSPAVLNALLGEVIVTLLSPSRLP